MLIWEFYLAYCEAAFDERDIDVVQYTLQKRNT
jgi:cyclopropane-fatty-acyl-phospholipid synthase